MEYDYYLIDINGVMGHRPTQKELQKYQGEKTLVWVSRKGTWGTRDTEKEEEFLKVMETPEEVDQHNAINGMSHWDSYAILGASKKSYLGVEYVEYTLRDPKKKAFTNRVLRLD